MPNQYQPIKAVAQKYVQMMNDGQILSNRAAIDIIDSRVMTLMERIDLESAPDRMKNLYDLWDQLKAARRRHSEAEEVAILGSMDAEFEAAYHDYAAWEQMIQVLDLRRKMVDSEVKVIKEMKAFLSVEMAYKLVAKLLAVCIRLIKDPKLLRQINSEFSKIIGEDRLQKPAEIIIEPSTEDDDDDG